MIVPGLDRVAAAVVLGPDAVRLVELVVRRGRTRLRRVHAEPIVDDGTEASGVNAALRRLRKRAHGPFVATALPGGLWDMRVIQVPPLADDGDRRAWLASQARAVAHESVASPEATGSETIGTAGEVGETLAVAATAPMDDVDAWTRALEGSGFRVLRLGDGRLEAASAFALGDEVATFRLVVAEGEAVTLVDLDAGRPAGVRTMTWDEGLAEAAAGAVAQPAVCVGEDGEEAAAVLRDAYGATVEVGAPLADVRGGPLMPEWAQAAGLAAEEAYPGLRVLDALPPEASRVARTEQARAQTTRGVLALALVALVLLGGVRTAEWAVQSRTETAQAVLAERAGDLAALRRMEARVAALQSGGGARTAVALALEDVARSLPEGVWLESLEVEGEALTLTALSTDDLGVEAAVDALAGRFERVRLAYAERVDASPGLPEGLLRFGVEAYVSE
ncbi:MAG: PilN domain-containing protein [Bacteroidota bacterium]